MIRIKGTLNIIWIADVWNDKGCSPYLVSNEAIRVAARSDRWGSILEIFQENGLTFMIFLQLHRGDSMKTNVAYDDYYT